MGLEEPTKEWFAINIVEDVDAEFNKSKVGSNGATTKDNKDGKIGRTGTMIKTMIKDGNTTGTMIKTMIKDGNTTGALTKDGKTGRRPTMTMTGRMSIVIIFMIQMDWSNEGSEKKKRVGWVKGPWVIVFQCGSLSRL